MTRRLRDMTPEQRQRTRARWRDYENKNRDHRRAYWQARYQRQHQDLEFRAIRSARSSAYYRSHKEERRVYEAKRRAKLGSELKVSRILGVSLRTARAMLAYGPPRPFKLEHHPQLITGNGAHA